MGLSEEITEVVEKLSVDFYFLHVKIFVGSVRDIPETNQSRRTGTPGYLEPVGCRSVEV